MRQAFFSYGLSVYLVFILLQVVWHWVLIEKMNKVPNHTFHALLRFVVAVVIIAMYQEYTWINTLTYGITFWFVFDTLLNVFRRKNPIYLSDRGIDALEKKLYGEYVSFVWKGIAAIGLIGAYYFN